MQSKTILDTFSAIEQRRSVKHFDPSYKFSPEEEKKLLSLALLSPTSFNIQNWRFLLVKDQKLKDEICAAAWNQSQIKDCSLLIVMCAYLNATEDRPERYWVNAPENVQKAIVPMIPGFYKGNDALKRDEAMRSCGIAAQTLMISAKAMGYDSCPMVGFDPVKVSKIINLPSDHIITMLLPIGKALKPANARAGQLPYEEVVLENKFN